MPSSSTLEILMLVLWLNLATDTTMLAMEAQSVIWARTSQMAMGQGTPDENPADGD
jgi:hypothetical protein